MAHALRRLLPALASIALLVACADSSTGTMERPDVVPTDAAPAADTAPVDVSVPPDADLTPASIDTTAPMQVRAGEEITARCTIRNRAGDTLDSMSLTPTITYEPMTAIRMDGSRVIASQVGTVTARCSLPAMSLRDETPASIIIVAGAPSRVDTVLDRGEISAGERANVTCNVFDAEGNPITGAMATVATSPMGAGITVTNLIVSATRAGMYMVSCQVTGAMGQPAGLTVGPTLPASLSIARSPNQPVYAIEEEFDVDTLVADRFGNVIMMPMVAFASAPAGGTEVRTGRFRYTTEGRFTVTARVTGPTEGGRMLSDTTTFVVDSSGPQITCRGDATMVNLRPGAPLTVAGSIGDTSGFRSVRVNGTAVTPSSTGAFTSTVTSRFGMNFVDISATDSLGMENVRTCTYLVSDRWQAEDALMSNGVTLQLTQAALDDGNPLSPITSIDDILQTVLNSSGLSNQLDTSLRAANPLKDSCDQDVCAFGRCVCLFRSRVDYDGRELPGPNTTTLTLVDGGLRAQVRIPNLGVRLRIGGTLSTQGWVRFSSLDVALTFDVSAVGGSPRATVRPGSVSVTVGTIRTDFSGLTGLIVDVVASIANGLIRDQVSRLLRDYIQNNFNAILNDLFRGLNVASLGPSFEVPRLDGAGTVPLGFGLGISALDARSTRLLAGIGTRFTTARTVRATSSLGIARQPSDSTEPERRTPATVAVEPGLLNQALHTLWRAGFFDATIMASSFGAALPAGTTIGITSALPPVAQIGTDGRILIDLGGLSATITATSLSTTPIRAALGARASAAVTLMGNDLRFGGVRVDEIHAGFDQTSMSMTDRAMLSAALRLILQTLIDRSLNDALPAIPIPGFAIPESLRVYGLPVGRELGITSPMLALDRALFVLRGGFGVR